MQKLLERLGWRAVAATLLVVLGGLGMGWRGVPAEGELEMAILNRARTVAVEQGPLGDLVDAEVHIETVRRDWVHEILGRDRSYFFVRATILGESACYRVEPGWGATMAYGPLSRGCL